VALLNQEELDKQGGVGYWSICDGQFEVWDRGDGIAEVSPNKTVGVVTAEMAKSCAAFDKKIGRSPLFMPVGFPISAGPIGWVHGERQPDQDETGYLEVGSAFPGYLRITGETEDVFIDTVETLEALLVLKYK